MIDGAEFARVADQYRRSGIPYSELDCQAFVERILSDCDMEHNWRGSNHMWRDALSWRGTIDYCQQYYGCIPQGAWLFTVKQDGGEKDRGYNDTDGNATHVGIYTGMHRGVVHSTTGGVQEGDWPDPRWTHIGLCKYIDYSAQIHAPAPEHLPADTITKAQYMAAVKRAAESLWEEMTHGS